MSKMVPEYSTCAFWKHVYVPQAGEVDFVVTHEVLFFSPFGVSGFVASILWATLSLFLAYGVGRFVIVCLRSPTDSFACTIAWGFSLKILGGLIVYPLSIPISIWFFAWMVGGVVGWRGNVRRVLTSCRLNVEGANGLLWAIVAIVLLMRLVRLSYLSLNFTDDDLAYLPLAKSLLETGSMLDPFNARRASSYGGQLILQAFAMVPNDVFGYQSVEGWSAYLLFILFLVELPLSLKNKWFLFLLLVPVSPPHVNNSACLTAVNILLLLFRSCRDSAGSISEVRTDRWKRALEVGLILAVLVSLRATFALWSAIFIAGVFLIDFQRLREFTSSLCACLLSAIIVVLCNIGPAYSMHAAAGTWLYPLSRGNEDLSLATWGPGNGIPWLNLLSFHPVAVMCVLMLLSTAARSGATQKQVLFAATVVLALALAGTGLPQMDLQRYMYATFFVSVLVALELTLDSTARPPSFASKSLGALWVSLSRLVNGLVLVYALSFVVERWMAPGASLPWSEFRHDRLTSLQMQRKVRNDAAEEYSRALSGLPTGTPLLAAVSFPHILDFKRYRVSVMDVPGLFVPPTAGRLVFSRPADALAALQRSGIHFLLLQIPDGTEGNYSRRYWDLVQGEPWFEQSAYVKRWRRRYEEFFGFVDCMRGLSAATVESGPSGVVLMDVARAIDQLSISGLPPSCVPTS